MSFLSAKDAKFIVNNLELFAKKYSPVGDEDCFKRILHCVIELVLHLNDQNAIGFKSSRENAIECSGKIVALAYKTLPYEQYLKTDHWNKLREERIRDFANRCAVCDSRDNLNVHHRTYRNLGREEPEDLTVLCQECHELFHKHKKLK